MHVTFAEIPGEFRAGDRRLVPATVAIELEKEGKIIAMEPWPAKSASERKKPNSGNAPAPRIAPPPQRGRGARDQRVAR